VTASSAVFLGADAGGSHTTVVLGSPAQILGRADGPGAAMRPAGAARSAAVLAETARRAAAQAGIGLPGDAAVVGAAGAGRRQEQAELEAALVDAGVARRVRGAALAPHVLNAAREGEVVAQRAVDEAARELVELVVMLGRHFPATDPIPVAITGGLLLPQSPLTAAFRERLAADFKRARLVP